MTFALQRMSRSPLARFRYRARFVNAQQAAEALGISKAHLANIESGRVQPGKALLSRMAEVYKCPHENLLAAVKSMRLARLRRETKHVMEET